MTISARSLLVGATALGAFAVPTVAAAADIATVLGVPTDPNGACNGAPAPWNDGLFFCPAWAEASCLHRVDLATVAPGMPNAVCSDGTAASFYFREGSGADVDRWVIHLQGGGACMDEVSCEARWCGNDPPYDATLMSNDWNADGLVDRPEHMLVNGISFDLPGNAFATWNHVFVPYCTADAWQGRESDVDFAGAGAFSVDARGHTILSAVRKVLKKDNADPFWTAVDPEYDLPDLDDATEVLFTGTSAGGYGALQNADWFLEPLTARTGLVVDAATDIAYDAGVNYDVFESSTNTNFFSHVLTSNGARWEPGGYWDEIDAFVDESCETHYSLDRCSSPYLLLVLAHAGVPLVETPMFLRLDLEDNTLSKYLTVSPNLYGDEFEIGQFSGVIPVMDDYTILMRETMTSLYEDGETDISVFAPRCGAHVGLEAFDPFFIVTTPETDDTGADLGNDTTFHDALLEWFDPGGAFTRPAWIDTDQVGGGWSAC